MRRIFQEDNYTQIFDIDNNKIICAKCSCPWDAFEDARYNKRDAWLEKKLCRHLKKVIKCLVKTEANKDSQDHVKSADKE